MQASLQKKIAFLSAIAALTSLGVDMNLPAVPSIEMGLAAGAGQGVLASSLFMAGFALTPLLGGALSDDLGRVRAMRIALACFALAALGCALSEGFQELLAFRFAMGCAAGMATTQPLAVVGDLFKGSEARQRMSEIATVSSLMPLVAPALGHAAVRCGGWRLLFGVEAAYGCLLTVLTFQFAETLPPAARQPLRLLRVARNCGVLLTERRLRGLAIVYGLAFASTFCFTAVSPLILIERLGMSGATYASVFAINSAGSILGASTSAWLNRRRVVARVIIFTGLGMLVVSTLLAHVLVSIEPEWRWVLMPAAFLSLYGFNLAGPSLLVEALGSVSDLQGLGSGMMRSIFTGLNFASSALLGVFCARHLPLTERAATLTMAMLACAALAVYLRVMRRQKREREARPSIVDGTAGEFRVWQEAAQLKR